MIRTLLAGAVVAFLGNKLMTMNREGKLDGAKEKLRESYDHMRTRAQETAEEFATATPPADPAGARTL